MQAAALPIWCLTWPMCMDSMYAVFVSHACCHLFMVQVLALNKVNAKDCAVDVKLNTEQMGRFNDTADVDYLYAGAVQGLGQVQYYRCATPACLSGLLSACRACYLPVSLPAYLPAYLFASWQTSILSACTPAWFTDCLPIPHRPTSWPFKPFGRSKSCS